MNKATISQVKNHLSAYLKRVRAGQPLLVMDREEPVAVIERVEAGGAGDDRLGRLERAGLVRRGAGAISLDELAGAGTGRRRRKGAGLVEAVLEERRDGR